MDIQWRQSFDEELSRAKEKGEYVLLDFSAAPM